MSSLHRSSRLILSIGQRLPQRVIGTAGTSGVTRWASPVSAARATPSLASASNQGQVKWFSDKKVNGEEDGKPAVATESGTASITFVDDQAEPNTKRHAESTLEGDDRSHYTVEIKIRMPDMGEGNDNKVVKWYKQTGDIIKRNDIMCDIETPDFTFGMVTEDEFDSIMGEIFVKEGPEFVKDGTVICNVWHQVEPGEEEAKKE
jgi:hypothetical protein